jgi:hypothetical protein
MHWSLTDYRLFIDCLSTVLCTDLWPIIDSLSTDYALIIDWLIDWLSTVYRLYHALIITNHHHRQATDIPDADARLIRRALAAQAQALAGAQRALKVAQQTQQVQWLCGSGSGSGWYGCNSRMVDATLVWYGMVWYGLVGAQRALKVAQRTQQVQWQCGMAVAVAGMDATSYGMDATLVWYGVVWYIWVGWMEWACGGTAGTQGGSTDTAGAVAVVW